MSTPSHTNNAVWHSSTFSARKVRSLCLVVPRMDTHNLEGARARSHTRARQAKTISGMPSPPLLSGPPSARYPTGQVHWASAPPPSESILGLASAPPACTLHTPALSSARPGLERHAVEQHPAVAASTPAPATGGPAATTAKGHLLAARAVAGAAGAGSADGPVVSARPSLE